MVKLKFTNAVAEDDGYGLRVNNIPLDEIISTALGTRMGNNYGYGSNLVPFKSHCCNIEITIQPKDEAVYIETDRDVFRSVNELKEEMEKRYEQLQAQNAEAAAEE